MLARAAGASGWATSRSSVLSDWTISGPSVTGVLSRALGRGPVGWAWSYERIGRPQQSIVPRATTVADPAASADPVDRPSRPTHGENSPDGPRYAACAVRVTCVTGQGRCAVGEGHRGHEHAAGTAVRGSTVAGSTWSVSGSVGHAPAPRGGLLPASRGGLLPTSRRCIRR